MYEQEAQSARQGKNRNGIYQYRHSAAELCRKHNISPTTFQDWKDRFLQGGKDALLNKGGRIKNHAKEVENLKRIIGEITVANDILKKTLEGTKQ